MLSFKGYITEMAKQGFVYEVNAAKALKAHDIVPKGFTPAGAGSDIPDLMIKLPGPGQRPVGCELKISAASAGSLVMKWDAKAGWTIGDPKSTDDEKLFIQDLAKEVGVLDLIKNKWKSIPYKYMDAKQKMLPQNDMQGMDKRQIYKSELNRFPEIKGTIAAAKIEQYYNVKKTYYVNVGTAGFYLLGKKNPLGFAGLPSFGDKAKAQYRARVQAKGGGNYQFTFEMGFSIPRGNFSPYNIAPTAGKGVTIKTDLMPKTLKDLFGIES